MIRNEAEYREAVARLESEQNRLAEHRTRLKATGLSDEEVKRVTDPLMSFHLQLSEELESYERLKRREFDDLDNLRGMGHLLISLRIAQGLSQRDLAKRLGVHESQVSRDERNEYFGPSNGRRRWVLLQSLAVGRSSSARGNHLTSQATLLHGAGPGCRRAGGYTHGQAHSPPRNLRLAVEIPC